MCFRTDQMVTGSVTVQVRWSQPRHIAGTAVLSPAPMAYRQDRCPPVLPPSKLGASRPATALSGLVSEE